MKYEKKKIILNKQRKKMFKCQKIKIKIITINSSKIYKLYIYKIKNSYDINKVHI